MNRKIDIPDPTENEFYPPRYDMGAEELASLEAELVNEVKGLYPDNGIVGVWIAPDHKYANVLRSTEASLFPEVSDLPQDIEDRSLFFTLIDTRDGTDRIVHSTTLSGVVGRGAGEPSPDDPDGPVSSGFIVIDDLIEMGNFTPEEFWDYYSSAGIDLERSIAVETNFRVGDRVDDFEGLGTSDIAYLCLFRFLESRAKDLKEAVVFASINDKSINSFERVGIKCSPLMGRTDLITSESQSGLDYKPVTIPSNAEIFKSIDIPVPQIYLGLNKD